MTGNGVDSALGAKTLPLTELARVEAIRDRILEIEQTIDDRTYKAGPWARQLELIKALSRSGRAMLEPVISRVSDKLHQYNRSSRKVSVAVGVGLELMGTADGLLGVYLGLRWSSEWLVLVAIFVLCATLQPLIKMLVGAALGVRYSYFYLRFIIEPRVKMRFGTYLALSTTSRVVLHFAGMLGSPGAFLVAAYFIGDQMPWVSGVCMVVGWFFVALNLTFFLLGLSGWRRIAGVFSGAAAALEIRNSIRARNG